MADLLAELREVTRERDEALEHQVKQKARIRQLEEALQWIAHKAPHQVSRAEAADMACEFAIYCREALARVAALLGEGQNEPK